MTREGWVWFGMAVAASAWASAAAVAGTGLLIPTLVIGLCAICAVDTPARRRVIRVLEWTFSVPAWRSALIVGGALMLIQLVPVELALLMAGEVLAYVEALAVMSFIAANTRLGPWVQSVAARSVELVNSLRPGPVWRRRQPRPQHPKSASSADPDDPAWIFA
jgi:energy-converting hydrogenase Eha subunit E